MPKVSVIMGVYNVHDENMIKKAIESILIQTYTDFEFIICDDGSSDDTYKIVKNIIKGDMRCHLIQNEKNMGLAQTLNNCISIAKGEYIARMDADDISLKDRFRVQVDFLDSNKDVAAIGCQAYFIDENDRVFKDYNVPLSISMIDSIRKSCMIHPSTMIRKEALMKVRGYTVEKITRRAEDYDLWCKLSLSGYKLANVPERLFKYREDFNAYKKRRYRYRIDEFKLKMYWIDKSNISKFNYIYAIRPLIIGLIPSWLMIKRRVG